MLEVEFYRVALTVVYDTIAKSEMRVHLGSSYREFNKAEYDRKKPR